MKNAKNSNRKTLHPETPYYSAKGSHLAKGKTFINHSEKGTTLLVLIMFSSLALTQARLPHWNSAVRRRVPPRTNLRRRSLHPIETCGLLKAEHNRRSFLATYFMLYFYCDVTSADSTCWWAKVKTVVHSVHFRRKITWVWKVGEVSWWSYRSLFNVFSTTTYYNLFNALPSYKHKHFKFWLNLWWIHSF